MFGGTRRSVSSERGVKFVGTAAWADVEELFVVPAKSSKRCCFVCHSATLEKEKKVDAKKVTPPRKKLLNWWRKRGWQYGKRNGTWVIRPRLWRKRVWVFFFVEPAGRIAARVWHAPKCLLLPPVGRVCGKCWRYL